MRWLNCLVVPLISGIWFSSCRGIKYIPIENVRTEIQYRNRLQHDSIHVRDSVFMFVKGDTVFRDRWHKEYKDRIVHDTSYVYITDSIQILSSVEKELTRWQQVRMTLGGWALGLMIVFILIVVWRIVYKFKG